MALTIGQLAKAANVKLSTIRFYERRQLIAEPQRTTAGYRQYPHDTVLEIRFIKNAQMLGFSLDEIIDLLHLQKDAQVECETIRSRTAEKIDIIDNKIKALQKINKALKQLHQQCRGKGSIDKGCAILDALSSESTTTSLMLENEVP